MTKRKRYTILISLGLVGVFLIPVVVSAAGIDSLIYWGPLVACQDKEGGVCTSLCDLTTLADNLIRFGFTILLIVIAPIMIVVGGGMILIAGASEKLLSQGKTILKGAVVGVVLALFAYTIVATFLWLIGNNQSGTRVSWPEVNCNAISPGEMPPFGGGEAGGGEQPGGGGLAGDIVDGPCPNRECQLISLNFDGGSFLLKPPAQMAAPPMVTALSCMGEKFRDNYAILVQPIRITEALPISSPHNDPKHNNGCAVDVTPPSNFNFPPQCGAVTNLIQAAQDCGLQVKNEYYLSCDGQNTEHSTGEHLHLDSVSGVCNN